MKATKEYIEEGRTIYNMHILSKGFDGGITPLLREREKRYRGKLMELEKEYGQNVGTLKPIGKEQKE